jgi:DNA processing protein
MDSSLILTHLSDTYWRYKVLFALKGLGAPPSAAEIADHMISKGMDKAAAWNAIDRARRKAELTQELLQTGKSHAVSYWSIHYPSCLRVIEYPPWNIFFLGALPSPVPTLAIVGTRNPSPYGIEVVASIVPYLTTRPLQITSGLAYGIDALAHYHACHAGIANFAVLGSGVDMLYPAGHAELAEEILRSGGGILSEFAPGTQAHPRHFPRRNRIIAGLADVIWVVQGAARSGSKHTVAHALEQGKTVAAAPGDIFSELSEVPHVLIRDGAQIILKAADLEMLLARAPASVTH